ncbi:hypothetical protein J2S56_000827 [Corynebacterium lowii]|nr:hypothetical protein [Corynebacterium lowii]
MPSISTDLNVLLIPAEWEQVSEGMAEALRERGYEPTGIWAEQVDLTCEPDNMLVTQYAQVEGHPPIAQVLYRLVVTGHSDL